MNRRPNFKLAISMLQHSLQRRLPVRIGNAAERHFKASFRNQGFTRRTWLPWTRTKTKQNVMGKRSRGILIGTGALLKSIRVQLASNGEVTIAAGNDKVKYAKAHNEGFVGMVKVAEFQRRSYRKKKQGTGVFSIKTRRERQQTVKENSGTHTVKAHEKKMNLKRRQFMGESEVLNKNIDSIITDELKRIEKATFKNV